MKDHKLKKLHTCFALLWLFISAYVISLLLFFHKSINYLHKQDNLLSNMMCLGVGFLLLIVGSCLAIRYTSELNNFFEKFSKKPIIFLSVILFVLQAYIFWNIYFITGWDSGTVSMASLYLASGGEMGWMTDWYYELHPNNRLVTFIITVMAKLGIMLGYKAEALFVGVLVQCALSCWTGYMLFRIVADETKVSQAYAVWIVYALHVALNPWVMILYTDALVLFVPVVILRLYQLTQNGRAVGIKWILIGLTVGFGFKLKPQAIIVFIAIVICCGINLFGGLNKKKLLVSMKNAGAVLLAAIVAVVISDKIFVVSLNLPNTPDKALGLTHFAMMGFNTENDGAYSEDDVNYSMSFSTAEERSEANIGRIKQRLQDMGLGGFARFITKKTLVNFGSGTYNFGREGSFYWQTFEDRNGFMSPLLKSIFYSTGENYPYFAVFQQLIWITMLAAASAIGLYRHRSGTNNKVVDVVTLTLIGVTLFQTIFEARTRYFFVNAPIFILAALFGWIGIVKGWQQLRLKLIQKLEKDVSKCKKDQL